MEREAKKKKRRREEEKLQVEYDHLSSLPDCLLHHNLSFLDTKTLLLTGILSKRWRALTTSFPILHFIYSDHKFRPKTGENLDNFVRFIGRTLLLNPTPTIKKFTLCFPYNEKCVSHLDACISFVMQKAIQELDLTFTGNGSYKLPSSLLKSETLISLKLKNCVFGARRIASFTKLTALYLSCLTLSNLVLEGLLKGCPLLEDLVMEYFMCCSSLKIGSSSLKLKRLTIKVDHYVAIDVEAPNLQLMKIDVADFGRCSFKEMLFLRDAFFNASCAPTNPSKIHSSLNSSLHSLPHAGFLVLSSACLQVMPIPTFQDLPPSFFKTKSLIIKTGIQKYEIPGIANLLWSSPDLEIS
ncbi:hypothetical protein MRB53_021197 [Persea americana]|uniref:Uncharacterized protein n=1 Tax=Persea americana TaxID=3435 RepID=A0ACC2L3Q8_PERAE|nr:hypothetical protein MRB53_021197 [Persea americana]